MLMQGRSETRLGNAGAPATYLRCLDSPFFPSSFIFAFLPPALCLFSFLCPVARSHRSGGVSALLAAQPAPFRGLLLDGVLRQTAAACDRAKHSVDGYGGVFGENTRFSVYIRYFGVTGH